LSRSFTQIELIVRIMKLTIDILFYYPGYETNWFEVMLFHEHVVSYYKTIVMYSISIVYILLSSNI